ncbi:MAG: YihY family inner membrane protein [Zoogloeaceae bacterium]|jgi:membrane protein|nr:YihY family inner membrane protein [Zoogloeaceae bacterium]
MAADFPARHGISFPTMSPFSFHRLLALPAHLVRVFQRERLMQMAAALSFSTLLTLVPLATLALAMAATLPGFGALLGQLDAFIMQTLMPGHSGGTVARHIHGMARNAHLLAWPWVLALAGMVFLLLHTLEGALNQIWGVREGRSWLRRFPLYLIGMIGTPVFMGMLMSLGDFLLKLSLGWNSGLAAYQARLMNGLSFILLGAFFALVYYAMPNMRVSRRAALYGGVLASLSLALMQRGFLWYVGRASFYSTLYGVLSALPIFLLWLYLTWVLVLVIAVLAAYIDR